LAWELQAELILIFWLPFFFLKDGLKLFFKVALGGVRELPKFSIFSPYSLLLLHGDRLSLGMGDSFLNYYFLLRFTIFLATELLFELGL
jgi:hypothetical protein